MVYIILRGKTLTLISFPTADDVAFPNGISKDEYLMSVITFFFFLLFFIAPVEENNTS